MSLKEYNKKRDFQQTQEPEGQADFSNAQRFVIQRHQASRLHYDLRLEIDGALKSWAIPKGPSMNPKDKRLAVHTEDHPIKYLTFYGDIPKGNYGAGHMDIWDSGHFNIDEQETEGDLIQQYQHGNLKIEFFGKKIMGNFALVKTKTEGRQAHWLLIKKKDEYATNSHYDAEDILPDTATMRKPPKVRELNPKKFIAPMLAETAKEIFSDPNWIYEFKWDGYRIMANINEGKVSLFSRNGISYNGKFNIIFSALQSIPHDVILDGEVVLVNEKGLPEFQKLQNYDPKNTQGRLVYYVFDVLHLNGHDTISLPLLDRKSLLPQILEGLENVEYCDHIEGMGIAFYERTIGLGMEGVMAKKADSTYSPGYRSKDWLKVKEFNSTEALICGYTMGSGRGKLFGSMILGQYKGDELEYVGNCGSGFSVDEQKKLIQVFAPLEIDKSPFKKRIKLKGREPQWMKPKLLCELKFSEWTPSGVMRHPVYKGLKQLPDTSSSPDPLFREKKAPLSNPSSENGFLEVDGISVPISNLKKTYWPDSGLRKYDLIDYYLNISETILPYLLDRPQNLHRHPNGITSTGFYQKDNESLPAFVKSIRFHSKSADRDINYLLCQNEATLLYMANLGCIEINPWNSRVSSMDKPDYTVIDLDPSDKNSFNEVLECARIAKEIFDKFEIRAYCKTTGKSGLHIFLPLNAQYDYDEARTFTKLLCVLINERLPRLTSLERAVNKRKGQIYLDFMQNRRAQTLASAYCVRPVKGATVSTPVSWDEVEKGFDKDDLNIRTIAGRISKMGDMFSGVLGKGIDMQDILSKFEEG